MLRSESEATQKTLWESVSSLVEEKTILIENRDNLVMGMYDFLQDYKKTRSEISKAEKKYENLLKKYNTKLYVDSVALTRNIVGENKAYIEKYFRIEKEELQKIIGEVKDLDARIGRTNINILAEGTHHVFKNL